MKMHFYVQPFILMFSHQYCIHSESRWTNFWNKSNSFIFLYFCTSRNSWTFHINYRGSDKYTDTGTRACEKKIAKMKWRSKYFTVYKFLYCRGVICGCENIIWLGLCFFRLFLHLFLISMFFFYLIWSQHINAQLPTEANSIISNFFMIVDFILGMY